MLLEYLGPLLLKLLGLLKVELNPLIQSLLFRQGQGRARPCDQPLKKGGPWWPGLQPPRSLRYGGVGCVGPLLLEALCVEPGLRLRLRAQPRSWPQGWVDCAGLLGRTGLQPPRSLRYGGVGYVGSLLLKALCVEPGLCLHLGAQL